MSTATPNVNNKVEVTCIQIGFMIVPFEKLDDQLLFLDSLIHLIDVHKLNDLNSEIIAHAGGEQKVVLDSFGYFFTSFQALPESGN